MVVTFAWPNDFTNRLDIYSYDGGGYKGLGSWKLADVGYSTAGTNRLRWIDLGQLGRGLPQDTEVRFYTAGKGAEVDSDGDGYGDSYEHLVLNSNPNNGDTDGDGVSDGPFDPDNTGSILAGPDAFPLDPNEWLDTDGDGIGDNADTDDDGDGVPDASDPDPLFPGIVAPFKVVSVESAVPTNSVDSGAEAFDVSSAGRMLPYAAGSDATNGYGRLHGGIYFNHDGTNLYIGIAGYSKQNLGDGEDALLLLIDSRTGGVNSLSAITTGPQALSVADNINFTTNFLVDVGVIVGARNADGKNSSGHVLGGKSYGQGVYALSGSAATDLSPAFTSTGPSPISQWGDSPFATNLANAGIEIAIPLNDILDTPWTMDSNVFIRVAAIVIGGASAPNRHLSRECYGESVSGSFGFSTTTLTGARIFLSATPAPEPETASLFTDNDVMLQGFHWDVPVVATNFNGTWYDRIRGQAGSNQLSRFTHVWMPPPSKGNSGIHSVGYDPFDYYDLGTYAEKFTTETRYGSETELKACVGSLVDRGIIPVVDFVLNHMNGGYTAEGGSGRYNYQPGGHETFEKPDPGNNSNRYFTVNYANYPFHRDWGFGQSVPAWDPSATSADVNELHPYMRMGMKNWTAWVSAKAGYRGYRWDVAQNIEPWFISEVMNYQVMKGQFAVMEYWTRTNEATTAEFETWLELTDRRAALFDQLLYNDLQDMCNQNGTFNMSKLATGKLMHRKPQWAVTLAGDHDKIRPYGENDKWGITKDKALAYAFIMISEGIPMVAYNDYFTGPYHDPNPSSTGWQGTPLTNEIDRLIDARRKYAGGSTLYLSQSNTNDLFIIKRVGNENKPGCILVLNDHMSSSLSDSVNTGWISTNLVDVFQTNFVVSTDGSGNATLSAPPRGYRVFVRQGDL